MGLNEEILSNLVITKIHSISTMYTEKKTGSRRENRPLWAFVVKYEGETRYVSGGKEYVSNINNIAVLPKGCTYDWRCVTSGHFSIIEFECDASLHDIFSFNVKNGEIYLKIIKKMEIERAVKKSACRLDEFKNLYGLLSSVLKTAEKKYVPPDREKKILPAIEYIAENYNKHICNNDLAAVTEMSDVYFRKLFKDIMGISPMKYVQFYKIKKAKEMLKSDHSSITDIAYSLGYNNVYEFSRNFKNHTGKSPLMYAKQQGEEERISKSHRS